MADRIHQSFPEVTMGDCMVFLTHPTVNRQVFSLLQGRGVASIIVSTVARYRAADPAQTKAPAEEEEGDGASAGESKSPDAAGGKEDESLPAPSPSHRQAAAAARAASAAGERRATKDGPVDTTGTGLCLFDAGMAAPYRGKSVFFLRTGPAGRPIPLDRRRGTDLIAGDLRESLLEQLSMEMRDIVFPSLCHSYEAWGKTPAEVQESFPEAVKAFAKEIGDVAQGAEEAKRNPALTPASAALPADPAAREEVMRHPSRAIKQDPNLARSCEEVLEQWCLTVEEKLGGSGRAGPGDAGPPAASAPGAAGRRGDVDVGPRTVLEWWRMRMRSLHGLVEQARLPESRAVVAVVAALATRSAASGEVEEGQRATAFASVRRWKGLDAALSEATDEAADNVKYLNTLERFIEPLYEDDPLEMADALPALISSVQMVRTHARYLSNAKGKVQIQDLLQRVTQQLVVVATRHILRADLPAEEQGDLSNARGRDLWDKDPQTMLRVLGDCCQLLNTYSEQFHHAKEAVDASADRGVFDFHERTVFGRMELFLRRADKLRSLFAIIAQFEDLRSRKGVGMGRVVGMFDALVAEMRRKKNDLLAFDDPAFDRDFVEFNVRVGEIDSMMRTVIDEAFLAAAADVPAALRLLAKFQRVVQRPAVQQSLMDKSAVIFDAYRQELREVRLAYDAQKDDPPVARNLPPVAGRITWARHLLHRIESPMKVFQRPEHVQVLTATQRNRATVRTYSRVARALVVYEFQWFRAWCDAVEAAREGLSKTVLVRHPEDGKLYVNFDPTVLQLIRESKVMDRLGLPIPDAARVVLLQEGQFKKYFVDLTMALRRYQDVTSRVIPVTSRLLTPHLRNLEQTIRPGMTSLAWTSTNIPAYMRSLTSALDRVEELVTNVNDVIQNRIEKNLRVVANTLLVDLPADRSFTLEEFVGAQRLATDSRAEHLQDKNLEVEQAVEDLIQLITRFPLNQAVAPPAPQDVQRLRRHYNYFMYAALLSSVKNSLNALKKRVARQRAVSKEQLQAMADHLARAVDGAAATTNLAAAAAIKAVEEAAATPVPHIGPPGSPPPATGFGPLITDIRRIRDRQLEAGAQAASQQAAGSAGSAASGAGAQGAGRRGRGGQSAASRQARSGGEDAAGDGSGDDAAATPFFEVEVRLSLPAVRISPSLEDVQSTLNLSAVAVLSTMKRLFDWGQHRVAKAERTTFFDRITRDIEIVRVVLLLTGSVQSLRDQMGAYLRTFERYRWLWADDPDAAYRSFAANEPNIEDYEVELQRFAAVQAAVEILPDSFRIGTLALSTATVKQQLTEHTDTWRSRFADHLHRTAHARMTEFSEYIKKSMTKLSRPVKDSLDALRSVMEVLSEVRGKEACIEGELEPALGLYTMLERYLQPGFMDQEELDERSVLMPNWRRLVRKADEVTATIALSQEGLKIRLLANVKELSADVQRFRHDFERNGPMVDGLSPEEAMERLKRFEEEFQMRARKQDLYQSGEALFGLPITPYPALDTTRRQLQLLNKLYGLYREVMESLDEFGGVRWVDVVTYVSGWSNDMEVFSTRCKRLPKSLHGWRAYRELRRRIEDFKVELPLLTELSKGYIRQRHWKQLEDLSGVQLPVDDPEFRLDSLRRVNLAQLSDDIEEICQSAEKQQEIRVKLDEVADVWGSREFSFSSIKERPAPIFVEVVPIVEDLDEHQSALQTVLTSRHITPFEDEAKHLLQTLSDTSDTLETWLKVQKLWQSLESVFLGGDIARQLPKVAGKFSKVDKDWTRLMTLAQEHKGVVRACDSEQLRASLDGMYEELEYCQKRLDTYLEQKRAIFPRFYFVSNPVLLTILSKGSDPMAMQPFYEKVFDAVSRVEHDDFDRQVICALVSRLRGDEERVELLRPGVRATGNIEDWLNDLLREMKRAMKRACDGAAEEIEELFKCVEDVANGTAMLGDADAAAGAGGGGGGGVGGSSNKVVSGPHGDAIFTADALREFVESQLGQYSLLGLQLLWTRDCEAGLGQLRTRSTGLRPALTRAKAVLDTLTEWCRGDMGTWMERREVETLVTIQVHQVEALDKLYQAAKRREVQSAEDFDWQKQARFYWRPELSDSVSSRGACIVSITDVDFSYQYEYLGVKERLVITELTDRCYITLAQAIKMHFGGAPAGPAGTGKTETVKDMGRSMGLYVVVTNCSSELMYTDCAKIFKGLCMGGLWGCFDEFNRITLPVLSVVAQQVLAVQNAKRTNTPTVTFPGDPSGVPFKLNPVVGFFITMNPGYAGRQELPENLKALFRGVAMMVPDRDVIIRVKLSAVGYKKAEALAQKFFVCYQLCEQQLSKQKHYDFGLRNILAVLRTAGDTLREAGAGASEEQLLYRTLRDMNMSKLVAQDVPLFLSMLVDLFPEHAPPDHASHQELDQAIARVLDERGLVAHKQWVDKVVQLYETQLVRHGIMLVGPTGGGKTTIFTVLADALKECTGRTHRTLRFNPKSVLAVELYGQTNPLSGEWEPGIFATVWSRFNNRSLPHNTWIIADGPVDTLWIESLNTVLDDNRLLTLASGDRIHMTDNVKMMFENESLANASPATVSRAGIVYVSKEDLDWQPVAEAWVNARPIEQRPLLRHLFARHVGRMHTADQATLGPRDCGHVFSFMQRNVQAVISTSRVGMVSGMLGLMDSLLALASEAKALPAVERLSLADLRAMEADAADYAGAATAGGGASSPPQTPSAPRGDAMALLDDREMLGTDGEPTGVSQAYAAAVERMFLYALAWSVGSLLEPDDRRQFDAFLRERAPDNMPSTHPGAGLEDDDFGGDDADAQPLTCFEWLVDPSEANCPWRRVVPPEWEYPQRESLDFSNMLVPTMDSTRAIRLLELQHQVGAVRRPVLLVGGPGTAKTSTVLMYLQGFDASSFVIKRSNFSSATTPAILQRTLEAGLEKHGGRNFRPVSGKHMVVFIDDISMPEINEWGDQPTNELTRQVIEDGGLFFLDKEKRGDFKHLEEVSYIAAMAHPGGGRNDVPDRLKRHFFIFNMVLPDLHSIDEMYGEMLRGRFPEGEWGDELQVVAARMTLATIDLWRRTQARMLPTPSKFHYIFNLRELSRVFQGVLLTPTEVVRTGGACMPTSPAEAPVNLLKLWKHECSRVFEDKLISEPDKQWFRDTLHDVVSKRFGSMLVQAVAEEQLFATFMRDEADEAEEDDMLDEQLRRGGGRNATMATLLMESKRSYEPGGPLEAIRGRAMECMERHNGDHPSTALTLVLFEDALRHLLRICRILSMPRGSALLVGVGGSGKQSLTRLAAYTAGSQLKRMSMAKGYSLSTFKDELKGWYTLAGQNRQHVTLVITDADIKEESFLEVVNSVLMTGDIPGLFTKDELIGIQGEVQPFFVHDREGIEESPENLRTYFIDKVRDNLHVVLCMSPVDPRFAERARKFPGLVSATCIDWFLPWPEEALEAVSRGVLGDFDVEVDSPQVKSALLTHMGAVHSMVERVCGEYYATMRRRVHLTPRSFLAFLSAFKELYAAKLEEVTTKEGRVNVGLAKLIQGARDVEKLNRALDDQQQVLQAKEQEIRAMIGSLTLTMTKADEERQTVQAIKSECEAEAQRIGGVKRGCERELADAQPILERALLAVQSIQSRQIAEVKTMRKPAHITKVVLDGVMILFHLPLQQVKPAELTFSKQVGTFVEPSWANATASVLSDPRLLVKLESYDRDGINEETIEFLSVLLDFPFFTEKVAKQASVAVSSLCVWVRAMSDYHDAIKMVKPRMDALAVAEQQLTEALQALHAAEERERLANEQVERLQTQKQAKIDQRDSIQASVDEARRKIDSAKTLIKGLSDERSRWEEDSTMFADIKRKLVGNCAVACAFLSYCGPFNAEFRQDLVRSHFIRDLRRRGVPVRSDLDVTSFLGNIGTIGDWNMQGLPNDPLSVQNGILVTSATRFPLLVDPQGQALKWISNMEVRNMRGGHESGANGRDLTVDIGDPHLKDKLKLCLQDGNSMVVTGVEESVDPLFDPVLEKRFVRKGLTLYVEMQDRDLLPIDTDHFRLYFLTRLPNPHFSPELQAKTTVVDFTVTQAGLEEQLLARVIRREQKAIEDQLNQVLSEVNANTKQLLLLNSELLERLTSQSGDLLSDPHLIGVLNSTKEKAAEVKKKLTTAEEVRLSISEKREQYRPVATRGSVLYFSIVEMSEVNVMYQTSLAQFESLFMRSMEAAERATITSKRVNNIIDTMTYLVYRYVNRGLYECDKLVFVFIVGLRILVTAGLLDRSEVGLFLRAGAALDMASVSRKKPAWIKEDDRWLACVALAEGSGFYKALLDNIQRKEETWMQFYLSNEPENEHIPDYEMSLRDNARVGPWLRLLLLRCLRPDRTLLGAHKFVRDTPEMGPRFVEPEPDRIDEIVAGMDSKTPVIFLLSVGADPTQAIERLAKKSKTQVEVVSLGQGQEEVASNALRAAVTNDSWVLLQNCELALDLMDRFEGTLRHLDNQGLLDANTNFRLFITALPHPKFPLGLLQMSIKVTNEPPAGLRAGLLSSYTSIVDQDRLERIEAEDWNKLIFSLCFLHSIVQERRKFGALGWCVPYEYNSGDLSACLMFLERHLYSASSVDAISWKAVQFMVSEVQYGGKVTDDMDRRLFATYTKAWMSPDVLRPGFTYAPEQGIMPLSFRPIAAALPDVESYRTYVRSFSDADSPEIFGLHPNADLTYRMKEATRFLTTMATTQPRRSGGGSSGGSGGSGDASGGAGGAAGRAAKGAGGGAGSKSTLSALDLEVLAKADDLSHKLPDMITEEEIETCMMSGGAVGTVVGDDGIGAVQPLEIFLAQELQRMRAVMVRVKTTVESMTQAINGEVVMTEELQRSMAALAEARVPHNWLYTPGGDEFSWLSGTLGTWFALLLQREAQYRLWLREGRPRTFWMQGFFNPQGFLTAMKQEVARRHRHDAVPWSLDSVRYWSVVKDEREARHPPAEGVLIHGLVIEGAIWRQRVGQDDRGNNVNVGHLDESRSTNLTPAMPVIHVTVVPDAELERRKAALLGTLQTVLTPSGRGMGGPQQPQVAVGLYQCPVYKYASRTDPNLIFTLQLPCAAPCGPEHWILRGVALLCSTE